MAYSSIHLYFDDLDVGQEWESGGRTVTEADIVNFAGFSGDFNPIHIDHEFAKSTAFRRPIAHGFGVFSIASGLGVMTPPVRTLAMLRVNKWAFLSPVFAGDTIKCVTRVVEKSLRGRGKRGEVVWYRGVVNQDGKIVQEGELVTLVEARPLTKADVGAAE
jgi:3-hydroxybutyryl-CoA dehydratase